MAWRSVLGLSERELWGQKPYDLGACFNTSEQTSITTNKMHHDEHHDDDPAARYAQKHSLDTAAEKELRELVEHASHDAHGHGHGHDDHGDRQCQVLEMPKLRRDWDEPEGHGHADWGSVFVDLVYVGVAYSLGIVLKNAFYSCKPPVSGDGSPGKGSWPRRADYWDLGDFAHRGAWHARRRRGMRACVLTLACACVVAPGRASSAHRWPCPPSR